MKFKLIIKQLFKGILPALPFGRVLEEISYNIQDDEYTKAGSINWPKLIMYIITGLIVMGRLLGVITNEDVATLIEAISNADNT